MPDVHAVLDRMADFADPRPRRRRGPATPASASATSSTSASAAPTWARPWPTRRCGTTATAASRVRFVSNVDGTDFVEATRDLDPAETLFIVASKTFTTHGDAHQRPRGAGLAAAPRSSDRRRSPSTSWRCRPTRAEVAKFGIDTANMFEFWDWVGGRYSYDSAIGLSLMIAIGPEQLPRACSPASTRWTSTSAPRRSSGTCRCCSACSASGTTNFFGAETHAILPYSQYLARLTAYLQQLDMETNGKSVDLRRPAAWTTRPARSSGARRAPTASTRTTS